MTEQDLLDLNAAVQYEIKGNPENGFRIKLTGATGKTVVLSVKYTTSVAAVKAIRRYRPQKTGLMPKPQI